MRYLLALLLAFTVNTVSAQKDLAVVQWTAYMQTVLEGSLPSMLQEVVTRAGYAGSGLVLGSGGDFLAIYRALDALGAVVPEMHCRKWRPGNDIPCFNPSTIFQLTLSKTP